jgi:hypothetical protein
VEQLFQFVVGYSRLYLWLQEIEKEKEMAMTATPPEPPKPVTIDSLIESIFDRACRVRNAASDGADKLGGSIPQESGNAQPRQTDALSRLIDIDNVLLSAEAELKRAERTIG